MTFEQLNSKLKELYKGSPEVAYDRMRSISRKYASPDEPEELEFIKQVGSVELVDQSGGEGKGEDWTRIYHLKDHDLYIRFGGFYTSDNGVEFDSWDDSIDQVKPVQRMTTYYE